MYGNNNNPAPGTAGGRCLPSVMIKGEPQPRCAAPSRCDTNDRSSTFDKCMLPARRPQRTSHPAHVMPRRTSHPAHVMPRRTSHPAHVMPRRTSHPAHVMPRRQGVGARCTPGAFPGSGLQANCKKGLVCKSSSPDIMPVCQYPGVKPNPPRPLGTFSYECEGTQCVLKKSPPDFKENRYSSLERCQAYCSPHHPSGLVSYDCTRDKDGENVCVERKDSNGRFKNATDCHQSCGSASLRMGYSCPAGTKVGGGACQRVPGIPGTRGVFADAAACSRGSNCHALPTSLMRDPYWAIGAVEPDPLMYMMSNVGDAGSRIQNFMGE